MTKPFLYISLVFLAACSNYLIKDSTSPLTFEEKTENFQKCIGENCATVDLKYPLFEGDTKLIQTINNQVREKILLSLSQEERTYESIEDAVATFMSSYENFRKGYPNAPQQWSYDIVANVTHQSEHLLSIQFNDFSYLGGAHPNTMVLYRNFDLSAEGTVLTPEKMLINRDKLLALAEEKFRAHHEVKKGISLEEDGRFFLEDGKFFLPQAMGYEGDEFVLLYNSYEIGPYAMGRTELRFPLGELKGVVYLEE